MNILEKIDETVKFVGVEADFGLGSPNEMPPTLALARIVEAIQDTQDRNHGYAPSNGLIETREALAFRNEELFGAHLDPERNITMTEGSREAIGYILKSHTGHVVVPVPYYPGHLDAIAAARCIPVFIPMTSTSEYISELELRLKDRTFRPSAIIAGFDNPNWFDRTHNHYVRLVELAKQYDFVVISDEAYAELGYFTKPISVMSVEGWMDVAYATQTGSKPYCMAGWKLGAVFCNPERLPAIAARKREGSEGGNVPGQMGWATCLTKCPDYPSDLAKLYAHRAQLTTALLRNAGITMTDSVGGMFIFFPLPEGVDDDWYSIEMAKRGFKVRPGNLFGKKNWIRWCLREEDDKTRQACEAIKEILS